MTLIYEDDHIARKRYTFTTKIAIIGSNVIISDHVLTIFYLKKSENMFDVVFSKYSKNLRI